MYALLKVLKDVGIKRTAEMLISMLEMDPQKTFTLSYRLSKFRVPKALLKSLKPLGLKPLPMDEEFEKLKLGYWRAGGRWVKECDCTKELGYPCYSSPEGVKDVKSCFSFLTDFHHLALPVSLKEGADVKYPWFYLRGYHLARASIMALNGEDVGKAKEFLKFVKPYYGPAWGNAMEAGIRALNAIFAMDYALKYDENLAEELLRLLLLTPPFIYEFMEGWTVTSNHTMMDLCGLIASLSYLSVAWEPFKKYLKDALKMFETEIKLQLGGSWQYEAATAYHLLVLEGILAALFILKRTLPSVYSSFVPKVSGVLREAARNLASITLPDSTFPLVGDNGSDRALVLERLSRDYTSTLTALALAKSLGLLEAFPKLEGGAKEELVSILNALDSKYSKEETFKVDKPWMHVYNDGKTLVALYCSETRKGVPSGHHHSDKGAFVIWKGKWVVLDPGTFTYTGLPKVRDIMRSALLHSAPRPCGKEQCSFPSSFSAKCFCKCKFRDYMDLEVKCSNARFRRKIRVEEERVTVEDSFSEGCWEETLVSPRVENFKLNGFELKVEGPLKGYEIMKAFWSPSYGVLREAEALRLRYEANKEFNVKKVFYLTEAL